LVHVTFWGPEAVYLHNQSSESKELLYGICHITKKILAVISDKKDFLQAK